MFGGVCVTDGQALCLNQTKKLKYSRDRSPNQHDDDHDDDVVVVRGSFTAVGYCFCEGVDFNK